MPSPSSVGAAPLPCRRERHLGHDRAGRGREALGDHLKGAVALPGGVREAPERLLGGPRPLRVGDLHRDERQRAVGERAGLVDADRVDSRQGLGGAHLLHERPHAGEANGRDGERHGHQQHQALGHHRHEAGGGGLGGVGERRRSRIDSASSRTIPSGAITIVVAQRTRFTSSWSGDSGWRKARASPATRLGVALLPDGVELVVARSPRGRTSPRAAWSPARLRTPSASPVRIDSSIVRPAGGDHLAVGDELVAGLDPDDVARDHLLGAELDRSCRRGSPSPSARPAAPARRASPSPAAPSGCRSPC